MTHYPRLKLPAPTAGMRLEWKIEDCWVGVFWKAHPPLAAWRRYDVWLCLLPTVPLHIWFYRRVAPRHSPDR